MKITLKDKISIYSTNGNLIRTLCAFAVIVHHSFYLSQNIYDPIYYITHGQIGLGGLAVAIFFFYSGLYVTKSLLTKNNHKDFFISRCKRIFPQLWIVIFISVFIIGPIFTTFNLFNYFSNIDTYKYLLNCLLIPIHNLPGVFETNIYGQTVNGALWTLPVEFLCYMFLLAISIIAKKIIKNNRLFRILLIISSIISILLLAATEFMSIQLFKSAFSATSFFFIGSLYYLFKDKIILSPITFLIFLAGAIISLFTPIANYLIILFIPYIIIFLSLYPKQIKTKTQFLNYSYEIYLIGFPTQQIIVNIFSGQMPIWINALCSTLIVILITFMIIALKNIIDKIRGDKNSNNL